jgi:Flp pilus assembly protein TadG
MPRGQVVVELALVLPILILLELGIFATGFAMKASYDLNAAATEAAIVGASEPAQPQRCTAALAALGEVYGRVPDRSACTATDLSIEISAGIDLPLFGYFWHINEDARAEVRR